jgi:rhamnosyltransferase subunit B
MTAPMRVLFGNEFGGGFGHVARLMQIESALRSHVENLEARYVLRPDLSGHVQQGVDRDVRQASVLSVETFAPRHQSRFVEHRFIGRLLNGGDYLTPRLALWANEIADFKPDLIISDAAPSLTLLAYGRVPSVAVGHGYMLPPIHTGHCIPFRRLAARDKAEVTDDAFWLDKLNPILVARGLRALSALPDISRADLRGIFTIAMFDPFWRVRTEDYLGLIHPGGSPRPSKDFGEGIVIYFSTASDMTALHTALAKCQTPISAVLPGDPETLKTVFAGTKVKLSTKRFELAKVLPNCGLVVHAGTLGMASAALYAGVPQVALFQTEESMQTGQALLMSKTGLSRPLHQSSADDIASSIQTAYRSQSMRNYAVALSERYSAYRDQDPALKLAEKAIALVA